ncbi:radial spoke head 1 homolog [Hetaerina americana]|uniref:radial spoke head 1 homolog n=1 Tax=Hetaerina americana TaxID=62018 RepID=UPI003A7F46C1
MDNNSLTNNEDSNSSMDAKVFNKFDVTFDPNCGIGSGHFTFYNGDTYTGLFKALKTGIIYREGNGVYTSFDGHVYDGSWASDILDCNKAQVQFPDGSSYSGFLKSMKYNGPGRYTFPDSTFIDAVFLDNHLKEGEDSSPHLSFVDRCGGKWFGETSSSHLTMLPVHHFIPREWKVTGKHIPRVTTASAEASIPLKVAIPKFSFPILSREKSPEKNTQATLKDDDVQHLGN